MQSLEFNLIKSQVGSICLSVRGSLLFIITVETSERLSIAPEKSFLTFVPRCASGKANFLQNVLRSYTCSQLTSGEEDRTNWGSCPHSFHPTLH